MFDFLPVPVGGLAQGPEAEGDRSLCQDGARVGYRRYEGAQLTYFFLTYPSCFVGF